MTGMIVAIQIHVAARAEDALTAPRYVFTRQFQVEVRHVEARTSLYPVALDVEESVPRPRPAALERAANVAFDLSLIHISEPTRPY